MRENKYRAWDEDVEVMLYSDQDYDDYSFGFDKGKVICWKRVTIAQTQDESAYDIGEAIENVMQYIGLKDKNGKDLDWWEGDIVKKNNGHLAEIIFCDGCFLGKWIGWDDLPMFHFNNKGQRPKWFEKISNIHEHPELLEQAK